jgi:hypothetical protein
MVNLSITGLLNSISRIFNKWMMTLLAFAIAYLLFTGADRILTLSVWTVFIALALIFTINGILIKRAFRGEIKNYKKRGVPLKGIIGFDELENSFNKSLNQSYIVSFASILSFILFFLSTEEEVTGIAGLGDLFNPLALTMAFVAITFMFLVEYPEDPSFTPGGLIGYYIPQNFPLVITNTLADVFRAYLDPATYLRYDEWTHVIEEYMRPEFQKDRPQVRRLDRAREKVLLLAYLSYANKYAFPQKAIDDELSELFEGENLTKFKKGAKTGLKWEEIVSIMKRIEDRAPELFRLVDRLLVNLMESYDWFRSQDLYFTVSAKSQQGEVMTSSGILAFFYNNTEKQDRILEVTMETDFHTIHPSHQKVVTHLDHNLRPLPETRPPLMAEGGEDILSVLIKILQLGTGIWFRLQPTGFGYKLVSLSVKEKGTDDLIGRNLELRFTKSLGWFFKQYAPKLSALGSVALPTIKTILGFA